MRYLLFFTLVVFLSAFSCEKDEEPPVQEQQGQQAFNSGGSGSGCTNLTYNGPTTDVQIETQCKLAQVYKCQGNSDGVAICCKNIRDLGGSCPYC